MRVFLYAALAVSLAAASALVVPAYAAPASAALATRLETARESAQQTFDSRDHKRMADALAELEAVIASPDFAGLGEDERAGAFLDAGRAAYLLDRDALAHGYFQKATAFAAAPAAYWALRVYGARAAGDPGDAIASLKTLAERWPKELDRVQAETIFGVIRDARGRPQAKAAWFDLASALNEAGWTTGPGPWDDASYLWRDLTLELIARGQVDKAARTARRVTNPYDVAKMHADKRFDPVVQADPAAFDIGKTAEANIGRARAAVLAKPRSLDAHQALAMELLYANRLSEALAVADEAIALAQPASGKNSTMEDLDKLNWALDARGRILRAAGRDAEALAVLEQGAKANERGAVNVSQTLNLGYENMRMGRPREALATVGKVTTHVSGYGQSVREMVKVCAHHQLCDPAAARPSLDFLRDHRKDARGTLPYALLCANDLDAVSAYYIGELADPERRLDVLAEMQDYAYPDSQSAFTRSMTGRLRQVVARTDVQAAIAKVGRSRKVPLMQIDQ